MKKLGLVVALLVSARGSAHADLADSWPTHYVDRPLVLLPGMTELTADFQAHSTTMTTLGSRTPDLEVGHAFGPLEIDADLGEYAELHATVATGGMPEAVEVYSELGVPQRDDSWHIAQGVSVGQRLHFLPERFAVVVFGGATLSENRYRDEAGMLDWSQVVSVFGDADAELQLGRHLAVAIGGSAGIPVTSSSPGPTYSSTLDVSGGLVATFDRWDIFASAGFLDVTDRHLLAVRGGINHFWGR